MDATALTRALVDIDSTTGREGEAGRWLAAHLRDRGYAANEQAPDGVAYLINGEPTDNRLGAATRGALRVRLHASGRAAHSSFPELGESAIDKLLDALMVIRGITLPDDPLLGRTHYSVG